MQAQRACYGLQKCALDLVSCQLFCVSLCVCVPIVGSSTQLIDISISNCIRSGVNKL